jgi:hypothetical protein
MDHQNIHSRLVNPSNPIRDGTSCEDPAKIAEASTPYWSSLFTRKATLPAKAEACLKTLRTGNRVLPPSAAKCGAAVTHQDVSRTCNTLPTGKSPGPVDRIPNKFYKTFSAVIAPILANVINESHEKGEFTPGFSDGLIALLYKKKERDDPRNYTYRPHTLLNGDFYQALIFIICGGCVRPRPTRLLICGMCTRWTPCSSAP